MVEVFLVHPDLNITDCSEYSSINMRTYQTKYVRAINEYERLIDNIVASREAQKNAKTSDSSNVQSLTNYLSAASLNDDDEGHQRQVNEVFGEGKARMPSLPDYDIELATASLSPLESVLLDFYKTQAELALADLNYVKSYSLMNETMREVFSKAELSLKEEEAGIKLISKHTESIKAMEKKLSILKKHSSELEDILVSDYGLLSYQDQAALSASKRKGSGNLNMIKEEETIV